MVLLEGASPALGEAGVASGTLVHIEKSDNVSVSSPAQLSKAGEKNSDPSTQRHPIRPHSLRGLFSCFARATRANQLLRTG